MNRKEDSRPARCRPNREPCQRATDRSATPEGTARELLQDRSFALLWGGQLLSEVGNRCLIVAGITLISDISASPLAMLVPALAIVTPQIVFGLVGGVIADRTNRKTLMVISDLLRALLVLPVLWVISSGQLWILYLAAAGLALVGVGFYPARNALLPRIVPAGSLMTANGLLQGNSVVGLVIGPAIAGLTMELWPPAAIIFSSLAFLISAIATSLMRTPDRNRAGSASREGNAVLDDVKTGLRFVRGNAVLRRVLGVTAMATLGVAAVMLLSIPHLKERLGAGALEYGVAMSVLGVGSLVGGFLATRVSRGLPTSTLVGGMLMLAGAAIIGFAYASSYGVVLISVTIVGMSLVVARGALSTVTQTLAPDDIRGRVESAVNMIVVSATALSEGISAVMGSILNVRTVFVLAGVLTTMTGLAAILTLRGASRSVRLSLGGTD